MEDQQLFKLALFTSIVGILGMMIFAGNIMPREIKIKDMDKGMLDEDVSLEGVVEKVRDSPQSNTYFLEMMDGTGKTTVVIFNNAALDLAKENLSAQMFSHRRIKVVGKVTEYNGRMELILKDAKSIKIVA